MKMRKGLIQILTVCSVFSVAGIAVAGPFADVPKDNWTYGALEQLTKDGIVKGYSNDTFSGENVLTRYEMAIAVGKAMEHSAQGNDADKVLINKLSTEFATELNNMGVHTQDDSKKGLDDKLKIGGTFRLRGTILNDGIAGVPGNPAPNAAPVKKSYWQERAMIDIGVAIDSKTSFFAQFSNRNTMGNATSSISNGNQESTFDKYGIKFKNGATNYTVGRQNVNLGQGGILNTGSDASGVDNKFDGIIADFVSGKYKLRAIGGKTTKITTESAPKWPDTPNNVTEWYGLDVNTFFTAKWNMGLATAHAKQDVNGVDSINYVSLNTIYAFDRRYSLKGEYIKSSVSTKNKAYTVAAVYAPGKDTYTARYIHVQKYGVDPSNSGIGAWMYPAGGNNMGNAYNGEVLSYSHPLNSKTTFLLNLARYTVPGWTGADNEASSSVIWNF